MQRLGLAVMAAVVLSMIPAAPQAAAAPFVPTGAVFTADAGAFTEVHYRGKRYKKHRKYGKHRRGCNYYRGPRAKVRGCPSRKYGHRYHRPYKHRGASGCVRFNGISICF